MRGSQTLLGSKRSSIPLFPEPSRSKMPEKTDEERERIAKKLAEQRAKMEGMPTTAKVSTHSGTTVLSLASQLLLLLLLLLILLLMLLVCSSAQN